MRIDLGVSSSSDSETLPSGQADFNQQIYCHCSTVLLPNVIVVILWLSSACLALLPGTLLPGTLLPGTLLPGTCIQHPPSPGPWCAHCPRVSSSSDSETLPSGQADFNQQIYCHCSTVLLPNVIVVILWLSSACLALLPGTCIRYPISPSLSRTIWCAHCPRVSSMTMRSSCWPGTMEKGGFHVTDPGQPQQTELLRS